MKKKAFLAALAAAALTFSSLAPAQGGPGRGPDDRYGPPGQQRHMQDGPGPGQQKHMQRNRHERPMHRGQGPRAHQPMPPHGQPGPGYEGRGAGPDRNFYKGGRLPQEYRNRQYVVDDWRTHHLSAPPRGYHWVQTGGDYVLVAIATGIILQVLLSQ